MKRFLLILVSALFVGFTADAQWQMPARQTSVNTNDFGYIPVSKTNAQLVFDWLDDQGGQQWTNTFVALPSGTYGLTNLWPFMTNVDNKLSIVWTNDFTNLADITTNLYGLWPFMANVDRAIGSNTTAITALGTSSLSLVTWNAQYTNTFTNLVSGTVTNHLTNIWPFMTTVDSAINGLDRQPYAIFSMGSTNRDGGQRIAPDASTWVILHTNSGTAGSVSLASNSVTHTISAGDSYWTIPRNGTYVFSCTMAVTIEGAISTGAFTDFDLKMSNTGGPTTNEASNRTLSQRFLVPGADVTATNYYFKESSGGVARWSSGSVTRVYGRFTGNASTSWVTSLSFSLNRIGD